MSTNPSPISDFCILPGETRTQDRIFPRDYISVVPYSPSKDESLTKEQREFAVDVLVVAVPGEDKKVYPFVLPCSFRPEWSTLQDFAASVGKHLAEGEPLKDDSPIGRSIVRSWIALADGSVYTVRMPGKSDFVLSERMPINVDPKWLEAANKDFAQSSVAPSNNSQAVAAVRTQRPRN